MQMKDWRLVVENISSSVSFGLFVDHIVKVKQNEAVNYLQTFDSYSSILSNNGSLLQHQNVIDHLDQ